MLVRRAAVAYLSINLLTAVDHHLACFDGSVGHTAAVRTYCYHCELNCLDFVTRDDVLGYDCASLDY